MTDHAAHSSAEAVSTWNGRFLGWLLALIPAALTLYFTSLVAPVAAGEVFTWSLAWVPSLNVTFSFFVDGLSLLMALLVCGIGTLIVIYAGGYLGRHIEVGRFFLILLTFMGAMLGLVLADNIITLFVFWELTSITSYLLIGFEHESVRSRRSAQQALLITAGGGLALMAGLILLGVAGGSWELSELVTSGSAIQSNAQYGLILFFILLGAFTKSAQFPFHFWLPNAMAAPTPVSAYLHSATMVKAGVYLLARLSPVLGGTAVWFNALIIVGGITALLGAWLAWQKRDLKRIMAYSTISALGTLVLLLGIGTKLAVEAAVLFLLVHSLYKGALFMTAGSVDHETGTRDVTALGGLGRVMPMTLLGVLLAALSMGGLPPLLGFLGKELMYESSLAAPSGVVLLTLTLLLTNMLMVTAGAVILIRPFFATRTAAADHAHEAPLSMWLGPLLLGLLSLAAGAVPALISHRLLEPAVAGVLGEAVTLELALWHGLTPVLGLSVLTWAGGAAVYWLHGRWRERVVGMDSAVSRFGPEHIYQIVFSALVRLSSGTIQLIQHGYLRYYIMTIVITGLGIVGLTLFRGDAFILPSNVLFPRSYEVIIAVIILIALVLAISVQSRLVAIIALGVIGYSMALIFVLFGAPDLAMTQFSIETLSVVLFVLVLYRLPNLSRLTSDRERLRDLMISLTLGVMMTILVLVAVATPAQSNLTDFFAENSKPLALGANVVNVILVDFRGLDTMIEITVLAVAALGVYALIKLRDSEED